MTNRFAALESAMEAGTKTGKEVVAECIELLRKWPDYVDGPAATSLANILERNEQELDALQGDNDFVFAGRRDPDKLGGDADSIAADAASMAVRPGVLPATRKAAETDVREYRDGRERW